MFFPQINQQETTKGHKETFGDDGYFYYLDHGDGNMSVFTYAQTHSCTLIMYSFFVYQLYLSKIGKKRESAWRFSKDKI